MAQREAEKLRRELDAVAGRQGRCFPASLKERVRRWIVERRAAGSTVEELATELGLARGTVLRWSADAKQPPTRALVPVEVLPDPIAARSLSVVSPSGFRIDSLSFAEAVALLRGLG